MSYEGEMLKKLRMPAKKEVEEALLKTLIKHNGTIKEFATGEEIVDELADLFSLNEEQRRAVLERIYKKENRIVKTPLWHRLLYRAADSLAKDKFVTRPTTTIRLTNKREWMLTEDGVDKAINLLKIPATQKDILPIKSYEVQKLVNKIKSTPIPEIYDPFENQRKKKTITKELSIRSRGFRQVVIESYDYRCSVCGLKINSPDNLYWEVEAAHIVPHSKNGKDDIWNGIALCRLHHWAFDVGWFSLTDDFKILLSTKYDRIPNDFGKIGNIDFLKDAITPNKPLELPEIKSLNPHKASIQWHRENIFYK
jgi:5-methylcytosine-specific restriction endonuclease McrA